MYNEFLVIITSFLTKIASFLKKIMSILKKMTIKTYYIMKIMIKLVIQRVKSLFSYFTSYTHYLQVVFKSGIAEVLLQIIFGATISIVNFRRPKTRYNQNSLKH
jgi:hypothetical protein